MIKLIKKGEHWYENGQIRSIIDDVEAEVGFEVADIEPYEEAIDDFADQINLYLTDLGYDVVWESQQSVGVGAIVQGLFLESAYGTGYVGDRELADNAFSSAVEAMRPAFIADCEFICELREKDVSSSND